ncbi:hypothetical protein MLD38_024334 [Melastoma candidum]|uniref:Uncharacterized protein n=1 Tax=Melastoma candidum TaxID=119954 RepID=A0ACB9NSB8_9MYRT|nr:hypothetical protein MLD38_024334 [Melastoma candidum]
MGTKIQVKGNFLGHHSMRDLNDNSSICSWPPYPGDNMLPNGHYYNGYLPRATATEAYPVVGKGIVRQTMLEHETIFRKQVQDLHRLYSKQKELMSEFKKKELFKGRIAIESSLASSPLASQITSEDVAKWHSPGVPWVNSSYNNLRPSAPVAEAVHSPASSARANDTQAADVPCHNGISIKSSDILESTRPSKVRRKMFDLQLPADQYIDDDEPEQVKDDKLPEILATPPKEDARADNRNGMILAGDDRRTDKMGLISGSRLFHGARRVADLNEPLPIDDETSGSAHAKLHINGFSQSSNIGSSNDVSSSLSVIRKNGRGWFSILEAGEGRAHVSQGDQMRKLLVSEVATEQSQLGQSRGTLIRGVDTAESGNFRESVTSSNVSPSYLFGSLPDPAKSWCNSVLNLERQGSCSSNQRVPSQNGRSSDTTSSSYMKVPQPFHNQGQSGDKQQFQGELPYRNGFHPGSFSSFSGEPPNQLCFVAYDRHGYQSKDVVSKELVQNRNDEKHHWPSSSELRNATRPVGLNATLLNGPSGLSVKVKKSEDRPKMPPWLRSDPSFSNEAFVRQVDLNEALLGGWTSGLSDKEKKREDHPKTPPWLKPETGSRNKDSGRAGLTCMESMEVEAGRLVSSLDDVETNWNNGGQCASDERILGFRISEKGAIPPSRPLEGTVWDYDRKTGFLDINLPCNSAPELAKLSYAESFVADKGNDMKLCRAIDLNLVISEDEASAMPCVPCRAGKHIPDIDLEAPGVPDVEFGEENGEKSCRLIDEGMISAAEAIVAITSSSVVDYGFSVDKVCFPVGCTEDLLNWLADVAESCLIDTEMRSASIVSKCEQTPRQDEESSLEEIEDFELMTLKLTETKPEDYFPKPFVPDIPKEDEPAANRTSGRPRRGQARRGRQRRDFQRDILPGLASLSRHEVTEDLQTFGSLMRATGHTWQSGLTRRNSRNGSTRGRRRASAASAIVSQTAYTYVPPTLVQQQSAFDAGTEDRSLTSWGKTTRRPRRQRCPHAGNPQSILVTRS